MENTPQPGKSKYLKFDFPYSIFDATHILMSKRYFLIRTITSAMALELLHEKTGIDVESAVERMGQVCANTIAQLSDEQVNFQTLQLLSGIAALVNRKRKGVCFDMTNNTGHYPYSIDELKEQHGQNLEGLTKRQKLFLIESLANYQGHKEIAPRLSTNMYELATTLNIKISQNEREDLIETLAIQVKRGVFRKEVVR